MQVILCNGHKTVVVVVVVVVYEGGFERKRQHNSYVRLLFISTSTIYRCLQRTL